MNNEIYRRQVALLVRIIPAVYGIKDFAIHGGTAINLFHQNMPRYSVDIDITYLPIAGRDESLCTINQHLDHLKTRIERIVPGIRVTHKPEVWKLQCALQGAMVKIEVNGTKRGAWGDVEIHQLCAKAQEEFQATCKARIVSFSQLYGGKVAAALSRQHPRDLFDFWMMKPNDYPMIKPGLLLSLCGSDKPILESLAPHPISQEDALEHQFRGMTEIPFSYSDYEQARLNLVAQVNENLLENDRKFLLSFEQGQPQWDICAAGDLSLYPAVQWKLKNICNLQKRNPQKYQDGIQRLAFFLGL